jgi:hypothetical protein
MSDVLREKIARIVAEMDDWSRILRHHYDAADDILALPELREALKLRYLIKAGAIVNAETKV